MSVGPGLGDVHEGTNIPCVQSPSAYNTTDASQTQAEMEQFCLSLTTDKICMAPRNEISPSNEQFIELIVPEHDKRAAMESILTKGHNGSKVC